MKRSQGVKFIATVALASVCGVGCGGPDAATPPKPPSKNLRPLLPESIRNKVEALEADVAENQQRTFDAIDGKPPTPPGLPTRD